jgi:hypothetical protein
MVLRAGLCVGLVRSHLLWLAWGWCWPQVVFTALADGCLLLQEQQQIRCCWAQSDGVGCWCERECGWAECVVWKSGHSCCESSVPLAEMFDRSGPNSMGRKAPVGLQDCRGGQCLKAAPAVHHHFGVMW